MFKIGQLVLTNDNQQARVLGIAETAAFRPLTYRVKMIGDGSEWNLPHGDLALPGEDRAAAAKERSAREWHTEMGALTDGHGGFATVPVDPETTESAEY